MLHKYFPKFSAAILLTLLITIFLLQIMHTWAFTTDDAFITLRYAYNLANSHGIEWNIGQAPVEGYSNFSYLLLAAMLFHFHLPAIVFIKIFSLIALAGACIFSYLIMRLWVKPNIALLAPILLLSYRGTILWVTSGLETGFYLLLVTFAVYCLLKAIEQAAILPKNKFILAGLAMGIAALTRPEAPVLWIWFAGLLMVYYLKTGKTQQYLFSGIICFGLAFLIIFLPYFAWRIYYFGHLFPNVVACKFMTSKNDFTLISDYLEISLPMLLLSLALYKLHDFRHWFLWSPSLLYMVILYGVEPLVAYFIRHFLAVFSLLTMSGVLGLSALFTNKKITLQSSLQDSLIIFFALVYGIILAANHSQLAIDTYVKMYSQRNTLRYQTSAWLTQHMSQNQSLMVSDCGIIPYITKVKTIDSLCLNSLEMTLPPINHSVSKFASWVLENQKPNFIIITRNKISIKYATILKILIPSKMFTHYRELNYNYALPKVDEKILHNPQFSSQYRLQRLFESNSGFATYQYLIYQRHR